MAGATPAPASPWSSPSRTCWSISPALLSLTDLIQHFLPLAMKTSALNTSARPCKRLSPIITVLFYICHYFMLRVHNKFAFPGLLVRFTSPPRLVRTTPVRKRRRCGSSLRVSRPWQRIQIGDTRRPFQTSLARNGVESSSADLLTNAGQTATLQYKAVRYRWRK